MDEILLLPDPVEMPDLACTLVAHHAGTHRGAWRADLAKQFAVCRLGDAPEDFVADAGRVLAHLFIDNPKLLLRIVLLEFRLQPEP